MRVVSKVVAVGLVTAALLAAASSKAQSPQVQHAVVPVGRYLVELWRDPADSEVAFRLQGSEDWEIFRRQRLYDFVEGHVDSVSVYSTVNRGWKSIRLRYGVTQDQADAALAAGDRVDRPPLMEVPRLDRTPRAYLFVRDFGTDVRALRKSARFPVPSPGLTLAGLRLADVALTQSRGPGRLVDGGYVANLFYSATPDRLGTGESHFAVEAASPRSSAGDSYKRSFLSSPRRLVGPGYEARLTSDGQAILRYHGIYVLLVPTFELPMSELRAALSQVANS
jgi:hypothetical protein